MDPEHRFRLQGSFAARFEEIKNPARFLGAGTVTKLNFTILIPGKKWKERKKEKKG